jgi:hypothetical protein
MRPMRLPLLMSLNWGFPQGDDPRHVRLRPPNLAVPGRTSGRQREVGNCCN